jgi:predicted pyridoxine 5'-phosphate oxidase superfamily flavin-nucleotide-binding protein
MHVGRADVAGELGTTERAARFYDGQVLDRLNEPMRRFIARQRMMFLATSDGRGACDSALRSGPPGFVVVIDEQRLAWPEYRGNGVMASRGNILENPQAGLLFVDFVRDVIGLHVNGRAALAEDGEVREQVPDLPGDTVPGRRAEHWVVVDVDEAYIHCAKHIPRLSAAPHDRHDRRRQRPPKKSDFFTEGGSCRPVPALPASPARRPRGSGWRRAMLSVLLRQLW